MAEENNKNQNQEKENAGQQNEQGGTPQAIGKLPLNETADQTTDHLKDMPGMPAGEGGRKGNVSVEDGGQTNGSSAGSR